MRELEKALNQLPKIDPSQGFIKMAKVRLFQQIELEKNESWFMAYLKKLTPVMPSSAFIQAAKIRLMNRILSEKRQPARHGWLGRLAFVKSIVASTLVMMIAVTTTLFFVEGKQVVSAAEDTYVEVLAGSLSIKHADSLAWNEVTEQVALTAGDLIKVSEDSQALVHFFDDSQIRLSENSVLLISQLASSPAYSRQGVVEVSLHDGDAWVQTLNVEDGYAGLTLITRDAIVNAINASFAVHSQLTEPTTVQVFSNSVSVQALNAETRATIATFQVNENNALRIVGNSDKPVTSLAAITQQNLANQWVQGNLEKDSLHLAEIRENGIIRLRLAAGALPGTMLYPIKQARERLQLAFGSNHANTQIQIANSRLNEAVVLLESGEKQKALEALMSYQSMARAIMESAKTDDSSKKQMANQLITPHQKNLIAALPSEISVEVVKEALHQTEELFAEDPIELEKVKLENSVERLRDASSLAKAGNLDAAKEAIINHGLVDSGTLEDVANIQDEAMKTSVLMDIVDLRNEEMALIESLSTLVDSQLVKDPQLVSLLQAAHEQNVAELQAATDMVQPLAPVVADAQNVTVVRLSKVEETIAKINLYNTWQGQQNQINRLLKHDEKNTFSMEFLVELRNNLDGRARDLVNAKILELEAKTRLVKSKAIENKIIRAQRSREGE